MSSPLRSALVFAAGFLTAIALLRAFPDQKRTRFSDSPVDRADSWHFTHLRSPLGKNLLSSGFRDEHTGIVWLRASDLNAQPFLTLATGVLYRVAFPVEWLVPPGRNASQLFFDSTLTGPALHAPKIDLVSTRTLKLPRAILASLPGDRSRVFLLQIPRVVDAGDYSFKLTLEYLDALATPPEPKEEVPPTYMFDCRIEIYSQNRRFHIMPDGDIAEIGPTILRYLDSCATPELPKFLGGPKYLGWPLYQARILFRNSTVPPTPVTPASSDAQGCLMWDGPGRWVGRERATAGSLPSNSSLFFNDAYVWALNDPNCEYRNWTRKELLSCVGGVPSNLLWLGDSITMDMWEAGGRFGDWVSVRGLFEGMHTGTPRLQANLNYLDNLQTSLLAIPRQITIVVNVGAWDIQWAGVAEYEKNLRIYMQRVAELRNATGARVIWRTTAAANPLMPRHAFRAIHRTRQFNDVATPMAIAHGFELFDYFPFTSTRRKDTMDGAHYDRVTRAAYAGFHAIMSHICNLPPARRAIRPCCPELS